MTHLLLLELVFFIPALAGMAAVTAWILFALRSAGRTGPDDDGEGGKRVPVPMPRTPTGAGPTTSVESRDLARSA